MTKFLILLGIILVIIAGVFFYQNRPKDGFNIGNNDSPKSTVKINDKSFAIEIADSPEALQKGLSDRKSLPKDQGLLFIFDNKAYHTFWMKNMQFPIDIIFIEDNKIISIQKNAQPPKNINEELSLYKPTKPINKVLEINAGLSEKFDFKSGDMIEIKIEE